MDWFKDNFLPSLFSRAGTCRQMWLTQKQTAVCTAHMEKHVSVFPTIGYEDGTKHDWYSCEWDGRKVRLDYSKLNGCGAIQFSMDAAELEEAEKRHKLEKARREAEKIEWIRQKPELLTRHIKQTEDKIGDIEVILEIIEEELQELRTGPRSRYAEERIRDMEDRERPERLRELEQMKARLARLKAEG